MHRKAQTLFIQGDLCTTAFKITYDEFYIYMEFLIPSFYAHQVNAWERLKRVFSAIKCFVTGKDFLLEDILFETKEEVVRFKEFVAAIDESSFDVGETMSEI